MLQAHPEDILRPGGKCRVLVLQVCREEAPVQGAEGTFAQAKAAKVLSCPRR